MKRNPHPPDALREWIEQDLSAAAAAGTLAHAFEMNDLLTQVVEVMESGRHPVLCGEPGVGKTAAFHELVRRSHTGDGSPLLTGCRVLQLSLKHRASSLKDPKQMRPAMQKLVEALLTEPAPVVPFFKDFHLAHTFELEPQFQALALRFPRPILAEGDRSSLGAMFENSPELAERYVLLEVEEPSLDQAERLLRAWSDEVARRQNRRFEPEAITEALHLSHRFLARSRLPRKALDLLGQLASLAGARTVTRADVIDRFCSSQKVPRALVDPAVPLDLDEVEQRFASQVLGQEEAVKAVIRMIALIKAGLSDVRRPFGVFLFVGPTGVGKTHVARFLGEYLFAGKERMIRFNMADYEKERDAATLFGDPDEYTSPLLRRGVLTQRLTGHPFAVLLFDEFEKAHETVHDRFLQLVDEGSFLNGAGETVSCRSMIIIATSNTGAEVYRGRALGFAASADLAELDREVDRRLQQRFRFEFLNRFDQVVHFHPLTREDIRTIARRELDQLKIRPGLAKRGITLELDETVLDWLAVHGYDPLHGARLLRRTIDRHVAMPLAETIVRSEPPAGSVLAVGVKRNRVVVGAIDHAAPAVARRESVTLPFGTERRSRSFEPAALRGEAQEVVERAAARIEALERRKEERSRLLETLNASGTWDGSSEATSLLGRYRELELVISAEERLAQPILRLSELCESGGMEPSILARGLEGAAAALREWEDRLADEQVGSVWLVISTLDPLVPAGTWVRDLAQMELAWCRTLDLSASLAAYEDTEGQLRRIALEVEGPGASSHLAMEAGIHRLARGREPALRAQIDIVPKGPAEASPSRIFSARPRAGPLGLEGRYRGRLEIGERGLIVDWLGPNRAALAHLVSDLEEGWKKPLDAELARVYAESGCGARDPRTGAIVPRLKEALKGKLDGVLEAWRRRP